MLGTASSGIESKAPILSHWELRNEYSVSGVEGVDVDGGGVVDEGRSMRLKQGAVVHKMG